MKKIVFALITILVLTGCSISKDTGTITCTSNSTVTTGITLDSDYNIEYEDGYVTILKTVEKLTAENASDLETYKTSLEQIYNQYNKVDYYTNTITIEDNTLLSSTVINYQKIDTKELIKIDENNSDLIKNGKVAVDDLKETYESAGATCK